MRPFEILGLRTAMGELASTLRANNIKLKFGASFSSAYDGA